MKGRTYAGARVGIMRMNRIIEMARAHGTLTIKFVAQEFNCNDKCAKLHLQRLVERGLMTERPMQLKNSIRLFDLVPGTQLLELPEPPDRPRPSVAKPKAKKRIVVDEYARRVRVAPAVQLGMQRDVLVHAFFGDWRAA